MKFVPHILGIGGKKVPVTIDKATTADLSETALAPKWQTDWTSDFIQNPELEKYALRAENELIALAAYEVLKNFLVIHIQYMEAHPASNPTITATKRKYSGIGKVLIAYGIKLSIDNGFGGDVILAAKTTELLNHYIKDFNAVRIPYSDIDEAPMLLISDTAALNIFRDYLE